VTGATVDVAQAIAIATTLGLQVLADVRP
jgi:hypothetical protein